MTCRPSEPCAACATWGCRVPADVSLVGFDDVIGGDLIDPPLTVIQQPVFDIGRRAIDVLHPTDRRPRRSAHRHRSSDEARRSSLDRIPRWAGQRGRMTTEGLRRSTGVEDPVETDVVARDHTPVGISRQSGSTIREET